MSFCPNCGMENADTATECRRCHVPLELQAEAEQPGADVSASQLGIVCRNCESYNEPGTERCTTCGYRLISDGSEGDDDAPVLVPDEPQAAPAGAAFAEHTPPSPAPAHMAPQDGHGDDLAAYAISADEAAQASHSHGQGDDQHPDMASALASLAPPDHTPADPVPAPQIPARPAAPAAKPKGAELGMAALAGAAVGAGVATAVGRSSPSKAAAPPKTAAPAAPAAEPPAPAASASNDLKPCPDCGTPNAPAAKFCAECGARFTPAAAKPAAAAPAPARRPPPSIMVEPPPEEEPEPVVLEEQDAAPTSADEQPAEQAFEAADDTSTGESQAVELFEEAPQQREAPFHASVVIERGTAAGTTFVLANDVNSFGGTGAAVALGDDPHLAPHAATFVFEDPSAPFEGLRQLLRDEGAQPTPEAPHTEGMRYLPAEEHPAAAHRLLLRDEGSANGVFVKVRGSVRLEPGDQFAAGERLLRFEGPHDLPEAAQGDVPVLGSPRPQNGSPLRISEVLMGGLTGRTCHRMGPVIAVGRTGCDLNFPGDPMLAARHAEIRVDESGNALLCDLGANAEGVYVRLRQNAEYEVGPGALLRVAGQILKVEMG